MLEQLGSLSAESTNNSEVLQLIVEDGVETFAKFSRSFAATFFFFACVFQSLSCSNWKVSLSFLPINGRWSICVQEAVSERRWPEWDRLD